MIINSSTRRGAGIRFIIKKYFIIFIILVSVAEFKVN
jgi:hypothetical protein